MTPEEIAMTIQEVKSRGESNSHRIDDLKTEVTELKKKQDAIYEMSNNLTLITKSIQIVERDLSEVKDNQKELSNKVSTLENAPARSSYDSMNKVKLAVITAICTAIATGILAVVIPMLNK